MYDKPVKQRKYIEVDSVRTQKELKYENLRKRLMVSILPLYSILLLITLAGGIYTDNEMLLNCFMATLKYMTPVVGSIYAFYFFKRPKK